MKYLIDNLVINADQIVMAEHTPADASHEPMVRITLTSTAASYDKDGWPIASTGERIELDGTAADLFWDAYIGDAYTVIAPKRKQAA